MALILCFHVLGDGIPTVFVAVAGRSNGLGPVMSGNTAYPVVNCPPLSADWGAHDVWSSLRLPSGKSLNAFKEAIHVQRDQVEFESSVEITVIISVQTLTT